MVAQVSDRPSPIRDVKRGLPITETRCCDGAGRQGLRTNREIIQLPGVDPEAVIIGAKLAPRHRKLHAEQISLSDLLDVASELSKELGKFKIKQEIIEPVLEDVIVDDLFYTQRSIKASFGYGAPLKDLVSWLNEAAEGDGSGHDFPFDLEQWREGGTPQVILRENGRRI